MADYKGGETTGFQSPAQDHIEEVVDLAALLDLRKPGMYPVRVVGQNLKERGIDHNDILIADATADPKPHGISPDSEDADNSAESNAHFDAFESRCRKQEELADPRTHCCGDNGG